MAWFQKLCRHSGLALHHLTRPADKPAAPVDPSRVVMRRTTVIEEVELPAGQAHFAEGAPSESPSRVSNDGGARDDVPD